MKNEFEDTSADAIDFNKLLFTLQRWAWLLALCAVIGAATAYFFSARQTPIYEAATDILVTRNSQQSVGDLTQSMNLTQLVETYKSMLVMNEFLGIVSERLNYAVPGGSVTVSAPPNTQIIELRVQDTDPARAALIADTMVVVLGEQNETLQAGRYAEAEQSLQLQIEDSQTRIKELQSQLDKAKDSALVEQVAQAQANINSTVDNIETTQAELNRLKNMNWLAALLSLESAKSSLAQLQSTLDQKIAKQEALSAKLSSDPQAQTDPNYAAALQSQIAGLDAEIVDTRTQIESALKEIEFLTPLETKEGFDSMLVEKESALKTQQSLLSSYQNVYTNLLSTEEVKRTTNEMDKLQQDLSLYQSIYLDLLTSLENVKNQKMQNMPTVAQVTPATAGTSPVRPRTLLNTLLGGLAGLILAAGGVLLLETTDDTIKSPEQVEKLLGVQVVGYVVDIHDKNETEGIVVAQVPRSPVAEAFRTLRTSLEYSGVEKPLKTILVTSSGPSEGKTTIAANLAAILAHSGKKVILLDADLRRPRIHRLAGIPNRMGLSDLLTAETEEDPSVYIQSLDTIPHLGVLPSGGLPSNPTELLGSEKMRQLLRVLADANDYVVIDSPPLLVADPQVLSGMVDGILLVMVPGSTRTNVTRAVMEQIRHSGARLLGVVFNRLKHGRRLGYSGYSYYYYPYYYSSDYYHSDDAANPNGRKQHRKKKSKSSEPDPESST